MNEELVGETTIPEEEEVEIADKRYSPVSSPMREDAPPLAEPDIIPQADLDTQIQLLQNELDKCKVANNHVTPPPEDVDTVVPEFAEEAYVPPPVERSSIPVETPNIRDPDEELPTHGASCCKALTIAFFFLFTTMLVVAFFVLESDLDFPVLKDIRQMPEVLDFKQAHYSPLKNTVAKKVGSFFKG
jgi:hypothetical protein